MEGLHSTIEAYTISVDGSHEEADTKNNISISIIFLTEQEFNNLFKDEDDEDYDLSLDLSLKTLKERVVCI